MSTKIVSIAAVVVRLSALFLNSGKFHTKQKLRFNFSILHKAPVLLGDFKGRIIFYNKRYY